VKRRLSLRSWKPAGNEVIARAQKSSLLEAVARERLEKTQQAGENLVRVLVICKVWRLTMAL
jgi:hypothetical protein